MSKIRNGGLDLYGKVQSLNGIGDEMINYFAYGLYFVGGECS